MRIINEMIAALYLRNKGTMKFSNDSAIFFIAKLTFSLPIFAWLTFFISLFDKYIFKKDLLSLLPKGKYALWPIILVIYFIFEKLTWKKEELLTLVSEASNYEHFRPRIWQFWIITIVGILLSAYFA